MTSRFYCSNLSAKGHHPLWTDSLHSPHEGLHSSATYALCLKPFVTELILRERWSMCRSLPQVQQWKLCCCFVRRFISFFNFEAVHQPSGRIVFPWVVTCLSKNSATKTVIINLKTKSIMNLHWNIAKRFFFLDPFHKQKSSTSQMASKSSQSDTADLVWVSMIGFWTHRRRGGLNQGQPCCHVGNSFFGNTRNGLDETRN